MEPFNDANNRPGIFKDNFGHYFPYVDSGDQLYYDPVKDTLDFRYDLFEGLRRIRTKYELARLIRDYINSFCYRISKKRAFIKDPNALFMAEWFSQKFNADIVVLIRHPAAFVSSLLLLKWYFPFVDLLKQKDLMKAYLSSFQEQIRFYAKHEQELIDQAILAWCVLHHTILYYQGKHDDWVFVRHEDLSRNPKEEFQRIFQKVGLNFDKRVNTCLNKYCGVNNPNDTTSTEIPVSSRKSIQRNSQSNIWNWKKRLSSNKIEYIRNRVESISSNFYTDQDW